MQDYKIKKVLNNNVVIAEKNKDVYILVGKGIGFDSNKGNKITEDRIESIFVRQEAIANSHFDRVLQSINSEIVGISEEIISLCENEMNLKLSEAIHISLPDHINFAIRRIKEGVKIENPFLHQLTALYPTEYKLAEKALHMINERFMVQLPEDEIGFICMHIKAAVKQQDVGSTLAYTKKIAEIMEFMYKLLNKQVDPNSLSFIRTITHLNFMIERIINQKPIKNILLDNIKKEFYNEYDVAIKVALKIENIFSLRVPEDEIGYIALHISRIREL